MFIEQAYKGNNKWWRVLLTTLLTSGVFIANFIMYFLSTKEQLQAAYDLMKDIPNNLSLVVNLIPFVFLLGLLFLLVYVLNNRSVLSLTTSRSKVDFKRIFFSFGLIVFISIAGFLVSYFTDNSNIVWNFKPINFFLLLFIGLILFPFQIGLEEYLFRGYLMQQIGVVVRNRWFPLLFTSITFGFLHSANPEVAEMGFGVMIFYVGTGLLLGIMTLMDEGMELALGFHFGNNLMVSLLLTSEFSALQTDALFKYSGVENTSGTLTEMIISISVTYPIILFILAKKYKWTNWKDKLTGSVSQPIQS
ncbi:MAG: CPBP family intramembrane metalloprotease [Flavobacterium sp.]|jgi:membrane protease YdiL (CAAX protease family)|nr:CPBP family intramembrane metalloprotease [Flavobacterium sp.]